MLSNKNHYNLSFIIDLYNTHLIFVKLFYVFDHLSVASVYVMKKNFKNIENFNVFTLNFTIILNI